MSGVCARDSGKQGHDKHSVASWVKVRIRASGRQYGLKAVARILAESTRPKLVFRPIADIWALADTSTAATMRQQ